MIKDISEIFSGTVEVNETHVGGQWKNKRKTIQDKGTKRGQGTKKQPVFVILCRNGTIWAEVVDDVEAGVLLNHSSHKKYPRVLSSVLIPRKLTPGSLYEDTSIVSSIMVNDSTLTEKEIISMGWRDSGIT
jgi:hypothetical protein